MFINIFGDCGTFCTVAVVLFYYQAWIPIAAVSLALLVVSSRRRKNGQSYVVCFGVLATLAVFLVWGWLEYVS